MFVPTLCPACTAVVVVAVRDLVSPRPQRCPCCGAVVAQRPTEAPPRAALDPGDHLLAA